MWSAKIDLGVYCNFKYVVWYDHQVADQQSAMFGQCCFDVGDVKCTMGTGTFIDCNTGTRPHASIAGEEVAI